MILLQKAIIALVSQECEQLGSLADECKSLISQFAPQVFAALDQELDQACYLVGLCTNGANQPKIDLAKYFRARIAESGIAASLKAVSDRSLRVCMCNNYTRLSALYSTLRTLGSLILYAFLRFCSVSEIS